MRFGYRSALVQQEWKPDGDQLVWQGLGYCSVVLVTCQGGSFADVSLFGPVVDNICPPQDMMDALTPIIPEKSSDTGAFDSVLELLVQCGRDIPEVCVLPPFSSVARGGAVLVGCC